MDQNSIDSDTILDKYLKFKNDKENALNGIKRQSVRPVSAHVTTNQYRNVSTSPDGRVRLVQEIVKGYDFDASNLSNDKDIKDIHVSVSEKQLIQINEIEMD